MPRPDLSRVPEYYHLYIKQAPGDDLMQSMKKQSASFVQFLERIPADKRDYRYAEGKWTIQEMLQHLLDTERVFSYRGLCFARNEKAPLPSFDENDYADNSKADKRKWNDMVEEFKAIRRSTEILFDSFDDEQLNSSGIASGKSVYVLGIGFIIVGHINHHVNVLKEKYGIETAALVS